MNKYKKLEKNIFELNDNIIETFYASADKTIESLKDDKAQELKNDRGDDSAKDENEVNSNPK